MFSLSAGDGGSRIIPAFGNPAAIGHGSSVEVYAMRDSLRCFCEKLRIASVHGAMEQMRSCGVRRGREDSLAQRIFLHSKYDLRHKHQGERFSAFPLSVAFMGCSIRYFFFAVFLVAFLTAFFAGFLAAFLVAILPILPFRWVASILQIKLQLKNV
jgi:hypothetical protein